ncbi:MAG: PQQ-dependent dehydrogenase, methanol/ethanol family, partial [Gammaproteobacteria bacterium]|nr:PQQ-dependent dehydrogenase, methanol/ethanol family [Gammaproteobacteria bacterium]
IAPDLRESIAAHNFDALRGILHDGLLVAGGMPKFDDRTDDEVRELLAYIRKISRDASQPEAKQ